MSSQGSPSFVIEPHCGILTRTDSDEPVHPL